MSLLTCRILPSIDRLVGLRVVLNMTSALSRTYQQSPKRGT